MNIKGIYDIEFWIGVNGNGFVSLHYEKPTRDNVHKIWISSCPFCNSVVQVQLEQLVNISGMTWDDDVLALSI
jgi:hypothetical protein